MNGGVRGPNADGMTPEAFCGDFAERCARCSRGLVHCHPQGQDDVVHLHGQPQVWVGGAGWGSSHVQPCPTPLGLPLAAPPFKYPVDHGGTPSSPPTFQCFLMVGVCSACLQGCALAERMVVCVSLHDCYPGGGPLLGGISLARCVGGPLNSQDHLCPGTCVP